MIGKVLVVDGDVQVRTLVVGQLEAENFQVDGVGDGEAALSRIESWRPDLVILDLTLPGRSGHDLITLLGGAIPVIVLTARAGEMDRITALDRGADDYVTKPFSPRELAARARSVLRRSGLREPARVLEYGRLRIDLAARSVDVAGRPVDLTAREFDLLAFLAATPRCTFSRSQLLAEVWASATRWQLEATVTEHMYRLRHKLESPPGGSRWLRTVRNVGYLFDPGPA